MGLILWPITLLVFLFWSLLAWLLYAVSDGAAAFLAAGMTGVLSVDAGPWAAWLLSGLGDAVQVAVVVLWLGVSLMIFAAPFLLRRRRSMAPLASRDWRSREDRYLDRDQRLRDVADAMVRQWRGKSWKKRRKAWDDD